MFGLEHRIHSPSKFLLLRRAAGNDENGINEIAICRNNLHNPLCIDSLCLDRMLPKWLFIAHIPVMTAIHESFCVVQPTPGWSVDRYF